MFDLGVIRRAGRSQAYRAIVGMPGWLEAQEGRDRVTDSAAAYGMAPLIFRAVRLRCDALASVPVHIWRGEQEVAWPFAQDLATLIWETEAALLLAGAAFWLRVDRRNLQWLNPFSVECAV